MLFLVVFLVQASLVSSKCRCTSPDAKCWPNTRAWSEFNKSLQGRLIKVNPPAWPCHEPYFNEQTCKIAQNGWNNPFWRTNQPGAMMENQWEMDNDANLGCSITDLNRSSSCYQGAVPLYSVNVTSVFQVQLTVKFASKYNLRLVIRNTGHDYLGRSTAKGSLGIWLHHLKNITFHNHGEFVPAECKLSEKNSVVTIGAGVQWEELYQATFEHNQVIVGGACPSVGAAGGYPQGGGHSPLSPMFGLAADNVLQYTVVTADGKLRAVSSCQDSDLFWALRGGGGGTFGIVISATYRTYPAFDNFIVAQYNGTANNKSSLQDFITKFAEMNLALSDDGWSGYLALSGQTISITYLLANRGMSFAFASLGPFLKYIQQENSSINVDGTMESFSSFREWYLITQCGSQTNCFNTTGYYGAPLSFASRLIPRSLLERSSAQLSEVFLQVLDMQLPVYASLLAGGQVAKAHLNNSVNPAWRQALWLVNIAVTWEDVANQNQKTKAGDLLTRANKLVIDITPGSGSYVNEADYNEPDWQTSFYGDNYNQLYQVKNTIDPEGLFVCHHCVGSENWTEDLNCKL